MLAIPVVITSTMSFAIVAATSETQSVWSGAIETATASLSGTVETATSSSAETDDADYNFSPPTLESFIHFLTDSPYNASTPSTFVIHAPNAGDTTGNVTGAITGTFNPVGATNEIVPGGPDAIRAIYSHRWSINTTAPGGSLEDNDDGSGTIIMNAHAFNQYANEAVFAQGAVTFEGRPEKNSSFEAFVGQVSSEYDTGRGLLDVFRVVLGKRVDGSVTDALEPPGSVEEADEE